MITSKEYDELKLEGFNIIPLIKEIDSDSDSPTSLYSRIKDKRNSFLLESIEGGEKWAQYSIIGLDCKDTIKVTGNKIEIKNNEATTILETKDPLNELDNILTKFKSPNLENMPRFYGGYVGFFAYESAQYAEEKIRSLQNKNSKFKEHMPDIYLVKSEKLIVYDNFNQTMHAIYNSDPSSISFEDAINKVGEIENSIDQSHSYIEPSYKSITGNFEFESNFTKDEYMNSVNTIKDYIEEGDVMQVVLAQDFYRPFEGDSFKLYSALRKLNPSPYMYYLNLDECEVVGSSPEILVRVEDDDITLRPIAGTRKRGKDKKKINQMRMIC